MSQALQRAALRLGRTGRWHTCGSMPRHVTVLRIGVGLHEVREVAATVLGVDLGVAPHKEAVTGSQLEDVQLLKPATIRDVGHDRGDDVTHQRLSNVRLVTQQRVLILIRVLVAHDAPA